MIDYDDSSHIYSYRGRRYLSATQVIEHFSEEFKSEEQAEEYARRHGKTKEHWLDTWEDIRETALRRGNKIHNLREDIVRNRSMDVFQGKPYQVRNINLYPPDARLIDLPDGIYPEMKLWHHGFGIAGRADKVILETVEWLDIIGPMDIPSLKQSFPPVKRAHRIAHIQDYKTNRFIRMQSYQDTRMKYPLDILPDCAWSHYNIQVSIYQLMLEYHGFTPGRRILTHFPHPLKGIGLPEPLLEPASKDYPCEYHRDLVLSMLNYLKDSRVL